MSQPGTQPFKQSSGVGKKRQRENSPPPRRPENPSSIRRRVIMRDTRFSHRTWTTPQSWLMDWVKPVLMRDSDDDDWGFSIEWAKRWILPNDHTRGNEDGRPERVRFILRHAVPCATTERQAYMDFELSLSMDANHFSEMTDIIEPWVLDWADELQGGTSQLPGGPSVLSVCIGNKGMRSVDYHIDFLTKIRANNEDWLESVTYTNVPDSEKRVRHY